MKIIICGPAIDAETEKKLSGASPAAGRFLNNMIDALKYNAYDVEKAVYISYPVIDKSVYKLAEDSQNIVVFKDKYILPSVIKFRKKLQNDLAPGDIVVFYNMSYMYFGLTKVVKKNKAYPVLMLADYTDYHEEKNPIKKVLAKLCEESFKEFDSVISLANFEEKQFKKNVNLEVLRGGINFNYFKDIKQPQYNEDKPLVFMYAGLLSNVTGVDILLETMKLVKAQNLKLLISGKGELEKKVEEYAATDSRVTYLGFLDVDDYYKQLNDVNIFINPRNMGLTQNKNNFPSKILEYLATGRVILSTKFSGSEDFDGLIEWFDGNANDLAKEIDHACLAYKNLYEKTYITNREAAKKYDWNIQAMKIIQVVNS